MKIRIKAMAREAANLNRLESQANFDLASRDCASASRRARLRPMPQPDFQPALAGPTVTVRPISADDWSALYAAGSDPEIWKVHPVPDRYTEAGFRKFFDGALDPKMGFAFVDRATGQLIGSSRYYGYEPDKS